MLLFSVLRKRTGTKLGERSGSLFSAFALALGIEGSSHDPKARRRGFIAPERPGGIDKIKHKEYKKHMDTYLTIPEVAKRLNVHRNSVLYWVKMGYVKAIPKNSFVSRPQFQISLAEVQRLERERYTLSKK
jgi:hypothetical protein